MRFITFLSAALFAVVFTVFGYFYFWSYTLSRLEDRLPIYLESTLPGKVKYERFVRYFDPLSVHMTVKGVSWSFLNPEEGLSAVVDFGDVTFKGDLFSLSKLSVTTPREIYITVSKGNQTERYRLGTTLGVFDIDLKKADGLDFFTQANMLIFEREVEGNFYPLLRTGYVYLDKKNMPEVWSASLNDLRMQKVDEEGVRAYENISLSWAVLKPYGGSLMDILVRAGVAPDVYFKSFVKDWFLDVEVDVKDARFTSQDKWYSVRGLFDISENGWLDGDFFVSTSEFNVLLDTVRDYVGSMPLALEQMMRRVLKTQGESQGVNFVLRDKRLYMNGSPAGVVPSLPEVLLPYVESLDENK